MADKEAKKPGVVTKFINWFGKSVFYGTVGLVIIYLINLGMEKLHAPLKTILVNGGVTDNLSEKLLTGAGVVVWVVIIGNIMMYFRGVKR